MKDWTKAVAGDVMSSPIITIKNDMPLDEAAVELSENRISGALVVDYGEKPIGVVSLFDIVSYLSGLAKPDQVHGGFYRYEYPRFHEGGEGWESGWEEVPESAVKIPVAEIMTPEIISVDEEMPLPQVVKTMATKHIHRVFVTRDGKPVGVISTMDVFNSLAGRPRKKAARVAPRR